MPTNPGYPTLLDPEVGLYAFLTLNLLVPIAAFIVGQKVGRFGVIPHVVAFLWVISSPLLMTYLTLPDLQRDEEPGPGDGMLLLPVFLEAGIIGVVYAAFLLVGLYAWLAGRLRAVVARRRH